MARSRTSFWPLITAVTTAVLLLIALPDSMKAWLPGFLRAPTFHLGLDLAGGTQLDFRISEAEMRRQREQVEAELARAREAGNAADINRLEAERQSLTEQQANIVEAIRNVIERRINGLGVSEATITPSYVGEEKHLLVECPGVVDVQQCIAVVGKTITLEFKEEFTEPTEEFTRSVRARAEAAERRITQSGATLAKEGQSLGSVLGTAYQETQLYYRDQLPKGLEGTWTLEKGGVIRREGSVKVPVPDEQGQLTEREIPGVWLAEVLVPRTQTGRTVTDAAQAFRLLAESESDAAASARENQPLTETVSPRLVTALRQMKPGEVRAVETEQDARIVTLRGFTPGQEEIHVSHILVAFSGATNPPKGVTRTKDQALTKAQELKRRIAAGERFEDIARRESDGESKAQGGSLGAVARGTMMPAFEETAWKLTPGQVSDPVLTQFGYHLIRLDRAAARRPDTASFEQLVLTGSGAISRAQTLAARLQEGKIQTREDAVTLRTLFFSLEPTGWKDTPLDGKHFRSAGVTVDPTTNVPVVQITFDSQGAQLFQELTKRNVGKRLAIFVGGELVTDPVVNQEITGGTAIITGSRTFEEARALALDLNTGAIPAPIHLVGQRTVEATLGAEALSTSLQAGLIGTVLLMLYMFAVYRLLGLVANVALLLYAVWFFALMKLPVFLVTDTYVVLTLAGMAGVILSIGMAVDANVLVFERFKEELRRGKSVKTATETSFQYAWPAIRDGNVSTLITCAILFLIGTSIVRGFAITLGIGVILSMFTAIVVSRWILRWLATQPLAERTELFGVRRKDQA